MELTAWYDQGQDDGEIVSTPDDLDRVLDVLAGREGRLLLDLHLAGDPGGPSLEVGVNSAGQLGSLNYTKGWEENWLSTSSPESPQPHEEHILYYYMMSDTEYPADCEIPLDVVRRAAHEFMRTGGERPTEPRWRALPDWMT
ncbi:hypothetical protein KCV87_10665 [Actinosynnema pretiosum subsp. pretiosum]|uniref:Immunity protein Imm1 n=1 Tax=Actinosynnema pretiosum subsp. pretiosum TaxID=103721 RepID=A0AA45LB37_9PSEU|nr:Imm1 family immunity protein [Actinosynnema mirum]QUF06470.1 hypothetical protein KCV87_10665 [Actinosynnema pretiosum subsp. pretiosum]